MKLFKLILSNLNSSSRSYTHTLFLYLYMHVYLWVSVYLFFFNVFFSYWYNCIKWRFCKKDLKTLEYRVSHFLHQSLLIKLFWDKQRKKTWLLWLTVAVLPSWKKEFWKICSHLAINPQYENRLLQRILGLSLGLEVDHEREYLVILVQELRDFKIKSVRFYHLEGMCIPG